MAQPWRPLLRSSARYAGAYAAGLGTAAAAVHLWRSRTAAGGAGAELEGGAGRGEAGEAAAKLERLDRKITKLRRAAQERIHWPAADAEVLGLQPRLWMEVLDDRHRYATLLYEYWRRWQLSDTRNHFFAWLETGQGSMVDLPHAPRRLLDEWRVIYLRRDEQSMFRAYIERGTGRFLWECDGTPVTVPAPIPRLPPGAGGRVEEDEVGGPPRLSQRESVVAELVRPTLELGTRRDELLAAARREVELAVRQGQAPSTRRLTELAAPLIAEDLLCQLRDPFFAERLDAATTPDGHAHLRAMPALPRWLLPNLSWEDVLRAIEHDQGLFMKHPFPKGEARVEGKGIFVLDSHGQFYCATKVRGVFHHSSFVRGHCVKVAGGLTIVDGWLQELSPHSGHYQPGPEHVERMIDDWKEHGVDFAQVHIKPYLKVK